MMTRILPSFLVVLLAMAASTVFGAPPSEDECATLRRLLTKAGASARGGAELRPLPVAEQRALSEEKAHLFALLLHAPDEAARADIRRRIAALPDVDANAGGSSPYRPLTPNDIEALSCEELRKLADPELLAYADWEEWRRRQSARPGEDGYVNVLRPSDMPQGTSDNLVTGVKFYFINGLDNTFEEARNSAQLISNELGVPVVHVYSRSARQDDDSVPEGGRIPPAADIKEAVAYKLGAGSAAHDAMYSSLLRDLESGREIRLLAHSRGAAVSYNTVNRLRRQLARDGRQDLLSNLTVITLGGYAPKANQWPAPAQVLDIQNEYDMIPWAWNPADDGKHHGNLDLSFEQHPVTEYLYWIRDLGKPKLDQRMFPASR